MGLSSSLFLALKKEREILDVSAVVPCEDAEVIPVNVNIAGNHVAEAAAFFSQLFCIIPESFSQVVYNVSEFSNHRVVDVQSCFP